MITNIRYITLSILIIISLWVISSAYFVNVEYTDGYATIANTKVFLNQDILNPKSLSFENFPKYFAERMPLNSILLMPAEWLARKLQFNVFDVHLHHLLFGLIHAFYIWIVYWLLYNYYIKKAGSFIAQTHLAVVIAFLASIPSFIFASYAPFLSADIYPGAIFLIMMFLTQRFVDTQHWLTWLMLICLGSCAPLIKHMYAFFWIIIIVVYGIPLLLDKRYRIIIRLFSGALISAALAWLFLSLALRNWDPDSPLWILPYYQVLAIAKAHPLQDQISWPWWFYVNNFAAGYGTLTTVLILPGIGLAFFGKDTFLKKIAVAWILMFLLVTLVPYRETRYLAFLAPLTAFLIVSPIQWLLQYRRFWQVIATLLLSFDLIRFTIEATIIYNDFFSSDPIVSFLHIIDATANYKRPIFMPFSLSFASQNYTPLAGDKLHRIFNLHQSTIIRLYNHPSIIGIGMPLSGSAKEFKALQQPETLPTNTILFLANKFLFRETGANGHYLPDNFTQLAAVVEKVTYKKTLKGYACDEMQNNKSAPFILIRSNAKSDGLLSIPLRPVLAESEIVKLGFTIANEITIYGFRVTAFCKMNKCDFFPIKHL